MPILPPITTAPYDSVEAALQMARVRVNDAIVSIGGEVLTDPAPFTQVSVNAAWRRLQAALAGLGAARMKSEGILYGLPAIALLPPAVVADPATVCWINWSQYFDGQNYFNQPVLPPDMIQPIDVRERPSASSPITGLNFMKMDEYLREFPRQPKQYRNWFWQWRDDTLVLPGATTPTDILIRYAAWLPDFIEHDGHSWTDNQIPIPRALNALSLYIASEVSGPRGDMDRDYFDSAALAATMELAGLPPPNPPAEPPKKPEVK